MSNFTWQFPENAANEIEGPNDAGITHFMGSRKDGVIREAVQNSLDACADDSKPVKVKFEITEKSASDFALSSLIAALKAAAHSPHNDEPHSAQFERGIALLAKQHGGGGELNACP